MAPDNRIAVCPGSYDPITNGHIDVITRASVMFDELIIAVVNASVRKSKGVFEVAERVGFIEAATRHLPNVRVDTFDVLIVDYARAVGAKAIVKGLRAISDFEYELEMNQLNRHLAADVESVYLMASPQYSFLSSSGVKEIATFGGDVSSLVPEEVAARLQEALAR
jgi:pantetheine-phosphate adenylyltransferase